MADEPLDQFEQVDIRCGAALDFLARLSGLLCEKGIIERSEVDQLLAELKPGSDPERSEKNRRRTLCYVSALDRLGAHLDRPDQKK